MTKNNRAARAARIQVHFYDVACKRRLGIFKFELLTTTRARSSKSFIYYFILSFIIIIIIIIIFIKNYWRQSSERTPRPFRTSGPTRNYSKTLTLIRSSILK